VTWEDEGRVLRCPWHGWEFDIETGRSVFNPHRVRARSFEATVETPDDPDDATTERSDEETTEATSEAADGGVRGCDCGSAADDAETPPVETYEVTVEDEVVVVSL
jgi:nitrite reductase/ring-hydroxylating ferredoxin subunit